MKYHIITRKDIDAIRRVIAEKLELDFEEVTFKADLVKDLGMDSLDIYEIIYGVEVEFDREGKDLTIPEEALWEHFDSHGTSVKSAIKYAIPYIRDYKMGEARKIRQLPISPEIVKAYKEERGIA